MARAIKFDRTKMHELRMEGKTLQEIASAMKCSMGTVTNAMRGIYGARDAVGRRPSFAHISIAEAYQKNPNMTAIAAEFKCSYGTVRNVVKKAGLPIGPRGRKPKALAMPATIATEPVQVVASAEVTPAVEVTPAPVVAVVSEVPPTVAPSEAPTDSPAL